MKFWGVLLLQNTAPKITKKTNKKEHKKQTKKEHKNFAAFTSALKHLQKRWTAKGIYFASDEFVEKKN